MKEEALQVDSLLTSIAAVSEETAAGAEEISASSEQQRAVLQRLQGVAQSLRDSSSKLETLVGGFTIHDAPLSGYGRAQGL